MQEQKKISCLNPARYANQLISVLPEPLSRSKCGDQETNIHGQGRSPYLHCIAARQIAFSERRSQQWQPPGFSSLGSVRAESQTALYPLYMQDIILFSPLLVPKIVSFVAASVTTVCPAMYMRMSRICPHAWRLQKQRKEVCIR